MSVDKTDFGFMIYNHANFIGLRKHLVVGQLNECQCFSAFHWSTGDTLPAPQCITVQWTNIENTVRAVHSCNSWFCIVFEFPAGIRNFL